MSKERERLRKEANHAACFLSEYESGIVMLPSPSQPSTHLRRLELQQPHVQLEGHFPCPEPECEQVLDSKKGLSNHKRSHKAGTSKEPRSRSAGSAAAAPLTPRQPILVNLDVSGPEEFFAEDHQVQPVAADGIRRQQSPAEHAIAGFTSALGGGGGNANGPAAHAGLPRFPVMPKGQRTRSATEPRRSRRIAANANAGAARIFTTSTPTAELCGKQRRSNKNSAFLRGANEELSPQLLDEIMANEALRRANEEHELRANDEQETESSDVDEDEYVVESDDDIPAVEPKEREERWVDPLPEKLQFQQQVNKIAELKCKYSRANAKVHWYKDRKKLFSDGLKYKILIDKQSVTLIINNPDPDDSGKYTCEANGVPTNSFVTVEDSPDQQPLSSTARRRDSRRPKSARKKATALTPLDAMQCCSSHLTPPRPKNTDLDTSGTPAPYQPLSSTARHREPRRPIDMAAIEVRCADEPLLAKAPFNVPGRPYPPEPLYTTDNSIMLKWERPSLDRGTPITDYELEIRERGTKLWEKATTTNAALWEKEAFGNVPDTRIKVTSVKRQQIYEFRVAAVNAAGRGEWSKNSVPIAATWSPCKPLITMGPLACDMTVLVGEQAKLLVPYAANSSRPKFVWSKNGKPMDPRDDPRVKEEKSDILIQLCYQKCEQSDTGTYSIRIVNDLGSDSVDLRLKVVDRPAPPEGSLKERTASSSGRRRVGSTAADRSAQAAAAACAADEEATDEVDNNEEERQNMAAVTKRMANLTAQSEDERRVRTASGGGRRRCDDSGAAADRSAAQAAAAACALKAKLKKRDDMSIRALKRRSVRSVESTSFEKEFDELRELCDQEAVVSWDDFENSAGFDFAEWTKIGEGAFGEIFKGPLDGACIVLKVIPFAANEEHCSKLVNGDYLKPAKFIFNELLITKELAKLSENTGIGVTPTFTQLLMSKIVRGCFPPELLTAWDAFKKRKPELAENERPDTYADEGLHFIVIGLSYGGKDLEAYTIKNGRECYSIFHQIALSIAIAEDVLKLEHRDLHAGNILVEECSVDEKIRYKYLGKQIAVRSNGVRASIIDYSISRIEKKGVVFFADLSEETGLFEQNGVSKGGDYQYDVYRMMKAAVNENWAKFWPQTNVLWMGYAAKKLFNNRFIRAKRKEAIENLFSNFEKKFGSIRDFIDHPDFLSVFAEFTSGK